MSLLKPHQKVAARCLAKLLAQQGSNLRPPESKSGVLPTELWAKVAAHTVPTLGSTRWLFGSGAEKARGCGPEPIMYMSAEALFRLAAALTLRACPLQHLLVLLLAHALTALLDKRSHNRKGR